MISPTLLALAWALMSAAAVADSEEAPSFPPEVRAILDAPDEFELLSLVPISLTPPKSEIRKRWAGKELFHYEGVVGKITVKDAKDRQRVVEALYMARKASEPVGVACFIPHHGIRARKGKESVEIVICFTCQRADVYTAEGKTPYGIGNRYHFGREFDAVLTNHGVPLEPR